MRSLKVLVLAAIVGVVAAYSCPPDDEIEDKGCTCEHDVAICTGVTKVEVLDAIARPFEAHEVKSFTLERANLANLLPNMFTRIRADHVIFKGSIFNKLKSPMDHDGPFKKAKLQHLTIDNTTVIETKEVAANMHDLQKLKTLTLKHTPIADFNKIVTELPNPEQLTELYIVNCGSMKMLSATHRRLESLKTLHLNYAGITTDLFLRMKAGLGQLRKLSLHHNDIDSLEEMESSLEKLDELDLSDNRIRDVPERVLGNFKGTLVLNKNPLSCSRNLVWLMKKIDSGDIKCTLKCLVDVTHADLK